MVKKKEIYMRLFLKLVSLTFLANFIIFSSHAEISLSGYQEFFAGSADQTRDTAVDVSTGPTTTGGANKSFGGFSNGRVVLINLSLHCREIRP